MAPRTVELNIPIEVVAEAIAKHLGRPLDEEEWALIFPDSPFPAAADDEGGS